MQLASAWFSDAASICKEHKVFQGLHVLDYSYYHFATKGQDDVIQVVLLHNTLHCEVAVSQIELLPVAISTTTVT